jgi:hypothetical protein
LNSTARGKEWLQTKLTIKMPVLEIHEVKATATMTPQQEPRNPFQELSARGKENRVEKLFKRKPELTSLTLSFPKQRNRSSTFQLWTRGRDKIQFFLCFMMSI